MIGIKLTFLIHINRLDAHYYFQDYIYLPPWNRVPAYFVGIVCGHYLSSINRKLELTTTRALFYWGLSYAGIIGCMLLHVHKAYDPIVVPLYSGFGKMLWAFCVCWMVIACSTGNGGIMAKILETKYMLPFSRLSYSIYLTNSLVIPLLLFNAESSHHLHWITYVS